MRKRKKSFGEYYIKKFLDENNVKYIKEKSFPDCKNIKPLRFDFYLPNHNILIEFQGMHHYKPVNKYNRAKRVHKKTLIHDQIKRNYCCENNITLIEIHYQEIDNINNILTQIIEDQYGELENNRKIS